MKFEPILSDDDDDRDGCEEEGTGREWGRESTGTGRGTVSRRYDKAVALTSRANTPLSVLPGFVSSDVTFHALRYSPPRGRFTDKRITRRQKKKKVFTSRGDGR